MPRTHSKHILPLGLLFLLLLSGPVLADQHTPEDYIVSKPLVLEIRYCECPVSAEDSGPSDLLHSFLDESKSLKVGVSGEDAGALISDEVSLGYKLEPVQGSPGSFKFEYVGSYLTSDGSNTGQGSVLLVEGQWVHVVGSHYENESRSHHANVALRLIETAAR